MVFFNLNSIFLYKKYFIYLQRSLEELELEITILEDQVVDEDSFLIEGMSIEGAQWNTNNVGL